MSFAEPGAVKSTRYGPQGAEGGRAYYSAVISDLDELRRRLERFDAVERSEGLIQAAVLVPILLGEGGWSLVFTRRTADLPTHPGEISFPGGSIDPGEGSLQAALREADEELGIDPGAVEVIGRLDSAFTRASAYLIDPWVGAIRHSNFRPNPAEIAEIIIVPVEKLKDRSIRREQKFIRDGQVMANPAYDIGANTIWGATARILTDLLEIVF